MASFINYSSPNIILIIKSRRVRWAEYLAHTGEMRYADTILVKNPEGKRQLGRPKRGWENIKIVSGK
jgi:hypothetical protein